MSWIAPTPGNKMEAKAQPATAANEPPASRTKKADGPARPEAATKGRTARGGTRSIARRMTRMAMEVCSAALLLAGLLFFSFDLYTHYDASRDEIGTLARITAQNVRTPLQLGYTETVKSSIEAVLAQPDILGVAVYRANGQLFTKAGRADDELLTSVAGESAGARRSFTSLQYYEPIQYAGRRYGTVVVVSTLAPLYHRVGTYAGITAVTMLLAWGVARLLAGRMQRAISAPIVELAAVAEQVARGRDYSIRAPKRAADEVGGLVESFNRMLMEIQRRDDEIEQARTNLEANVMSRTSELHQQIEDRKLAQAAMKDSELRYRNLFENNPMPMFVVDLETLEFMAVNNAALRHYGYSEVEFHRLSLPGITQQKDPLEVARTLRSAAKSLDAGEWRHRKRNGEIIEVHLTAHAIVLGGKVAKIVLANDVTERNRTQRELDDLNRQLVEASRQAGMAEIATGVLHNVGNVLNSVNVSASVLVDSVHDTKAAGVRKVAELLQLHAHDLPQFFGEGGRGQKLPQYLAALAIQLENEQRARLQELELLIQNVEHIKEIVVMQQDYAKVTGVLGQHAPARLVEDALRMAGPDLEQQSVAAHVEAEADLPDVYTDRHKVIQILLNLLSNARQAMEATPEHERAVDIQIARAGRRVRIRVRDYGCGIPAENLTRIFNHGFTTKKAGHGFGLHSSANAAREMGGALTAASHGRGATFILELPIRTDYPKNSSTVTVPKAST